MEYFRVHQGLLLISVFFLVSALATEPTFSPGPSPNLQPVSSLNAEPETSPTPSSFPPLNHISFPPSGSDASSPSISPSSLDSPDVPQDSPDGPEESPEGPDGEAPLSVPSHPQDSPDGAEYSPEGPDGEVPLSVQSHPTGSFTMPDVEAPAQEIANDKANPEVKKVCGSTDFPSLCINTIDPFVKNTPEVSLDTVLEVSIKAAQDLAKAALVMTRKLSNTPGIPSDIASVLKDCQEGYDEALYDFQNAIEAHETRDIGTMNTMLSAVITYVGDCNDEFSSLNIPSPIAEFGEKLANMTSNCLAMVSLLQNRSQNI